MGVVISVYNQKGGVGKTSTCKHLGGALARGGRRVLLIDNDPQASLTKGFWGAAEAKLIGRDDGVASLYDPRLLPMPGRIVRATGVAGISLIPGARALEDHNITPRARWADRESGIRDFLSEVAGDYDVTLIDNPPNLYLCSHASLVASDCVLIPVEPEDLAVQGIEPVLEGIAAARGGPNPDLSLLGILLTRYDRRLAIHEAYAALLREVHGDAVLGSLFPLANDFKLADSERKPIHTFKPRSAAAKAVAAIADEVMGRLLPRAAEVAA